MNANANLIFLESDENLRVIVTYLSRSGREYPIIFDDFAHTDVLQAWKEITKEKEDLEKHWGPLTLFNIEEGEQYLLEEIFDDEEVVTIKEASERLGKGYSQRAILRRIKSGEWERNRQYAIFQVEGSCKQVIRIFMSEFKEELLPAPVNDLQPKPKLISA